MKLPISVISVILACSLTAKANAETYKCLLNDWSGGLTESVTINWLGNAFDADSTAERVRQYYGTQTTQWIETDVITNRNFITFRYYDEVPINNIAHPRRVSLRIYIDGSQRCSILSSVHNYIDMQADGSWR
jgi:hypothetical protein